ncbi:MAG: response regulator transcription factor [Thermomicrobiales bacterium]|nr:response regulator transcription factor [Thermomicrobiales bacterium]
MTDAPIRILLIDDHAVFRQPLTFMLEREPDLTVVAQVGSLHEARKILAAQASAIDLALVDLRLPDGVGIDLVRELRDMNPEAHSVVLTADTDRVLHARALEAGASAVVSKTAQLAEIIDAVRRVHKGESIQSAREIIELLRLAGEERERDQARQEMLARLTPRELQVLESLSEGLDNRAIADRLFISPETARTHVVKLLAKLNVESRLQAAIFAIENGIGPATWTSNGSSTSSSAKR